MTDTLQTVLDRIQKASQLLNDITIGEKDPVLKSYQLELADMRSHIQNIEQQQTNALNTGEIRKMLAGCRVELFRMLQEIDLLMTDSADVYRQSIGDRKNEFEQLSDEMQQKSDPQVYQHKYVYWQLFDSKDQIRLLTSSIMDLEGQLEHEQLVHKGLTAGGDSDVSDLGAPSDRPSLSP
jgi:hypothetical protein